MCYLWGNTDGGGPDESAEIHVFSGTVTVTFSSVQGLTTWPGNGNIGDDPLFVDPNGPDGDPNTWDDNDYRLRGDSPCVDAGDPNFVTDPNAPTDIDGEPRVMGQYVDMGSDEYPGSPYWYSLDLTLKDPGPSTVEIDPNDPNWVPHVYPAGTELTLTAVPAGNKSFKKWRIWDPNDPNYFVIDTNNPLYLTMDGDYTVKAIFKCGGGGMEPLLPMLAVLVGLATLRRRYRA